jgi:hypothetical protein
MCECWRGGGWWNVAEDMWVLWFQRYLVKWCSESFFSAVHHTEEEHSQQTPELIGANHIQAHIMTGGYSEWFQFQVLKLSADFRVERCLITFQSPGPHRDRRLLTALSSRFWNSQRTPELIGANHIPITRPISWQAFTASALSSRFWNPFS